jgi:hypothetical protein
MAEKVAGQVLALGAERLEERSRRETGGGDDAGEAVGVKGVLKALGSVMKR